MTNQRKLCNFFKLVYYTLIGEEVETAPHRDMMGNDSCGWNYVKFSRLSNVKITVSLGLYWSYAFTHPLRCWQRLDYITGCHKIETARNVTTETRLCWQTETDSITTSSTKTLVLNVYLTRFDVIAWISCNSVVIFTLFKHVYVESGLKHHPYNLPYFVTDSRTWCVSRIACFIE